MNTFLSNSIYFCRNQEIEEYRDLVYMFDALEKLFEFLSTRRGL
jgi:hypothetical protein